MPKTRSESVALNTSASLIQNLFVQLMNFIMLSVFATSLGKEYMGVSGVFSSILTALSFAELGIGSAIAYALYKPLRNHDDERVAALMHFYKNAYRLVAAFVAAAGILCIPFLPHLTKASDIPNIHEPIWQIFMLYIIDNASSYLLVYKSTLLNAGQKRYIISKISILFSVIRMTVQCILLLIFHNFLLFLIVGILETLARNLTISRAADREFPKVKDYPDARLEKPEVKKLLHDVFALSLYKINSVVLNSTDNMIISAMIPGSSNNVGQLRGYTTMNKTIDSLVNQFNLSALPSLGNLAAEDDGKKQLRIFETLQFIAFWCACFTTTSLFVLTTPFIQHLWLGQQYVQPNLIVFVLLLDYYVQMMMRPIYNFRNANGLFVQGKYRPLIMMLLNVGLSILLAIPWGIFGILFATTISRLLTVMWYDPYLVYSRVFKSPLRDYFKRYVKYTALTALCVAGVYYLGQLIQTGYGIWDFLIKLVLCAIIPNAMIVLLYRKSPEYHEFMIRLKNVVDKVLSAIRRRLRRDPKQDGTNR